MQCTTSSLGFQSPSNGPAESVDGSFGLWGGGGGGGEGSGLEG